jgi:ketosteroid isomerase-like protein
VAFFMPITPVGAAWAILFGILQFSIPRKPFFCSKNKCMKKIVLSLSLLAAACITQAQLKKEQQLEEARKAIVASNAIYSDLANKDDGSILTRYTDDACLLPPNSAPICGRDNILHFFKGGPKVHSLFTIQNIYGDGNDFVTEESHYELFDGNNKKLDDGKVIVIWKKTKDGWKMHRDIFSSNHAPQH